MGLTSQEHRHALEVHAEKDVAMPVTRSVAVSNIEVIQKVLTDGRLTSDSGEEEPVLFTNEEGRAKTFVPVEKEIHGENPVLSKAAMVLANAPLA